MVVGRFSRGTLCASRPHSVKSYLPLSGSLSLTMKTHAELRTLLISRSTRLKHLENLSPIKSGIVILGDSIVQAGNWSSLVGGGIRNLGVGDFTTRDLLRHLSKLLRVTPDTVIVAIGINDLIRNKRLDKSDGNIRSIISGIKTVRGNPRIFVVSVLPVDQPGYPEIGKAIESFNLMLATSCSETGVTYINAHDCFLEKDGVLNSKYTVDGLHLTDEGYAQYAVVLKYFI